MKNPLKDLYEALGENPRNQRYPSVMKLDDHSKQEIDTLTEEAYSTEFFLESPRTAHEETTYQQRSRLRLEYPPERAPVQFKLQKRTSELSLTTTPPVQNFTPLQLAAAKIPEIQHFKKSPSDQKFSILNEAEVRRIIKNEKYNKIL